MEDIKIYVKEKNLRKLSDDLDGVYSKLSDVRDALERMHIDIERIWNDESAAIFLTKFDNGLERIWDLLIAIDSMDDLFIAAVEGYTAADRRVMSLE